MSNVKDHYEGLLADHYGWMFGVTTAWKAKEQQELLARLKLSGGELAVDLGAGSGFQSIALADLGFKRVIAIDTSPKLLKELRFNVRDRHVEAIEADMMDLSAHVSPGTADAIVCMGDTLTHLPARELVPKLFAAVSEALRSQGRFVLTYRDLSEELHGIDRFITVRSTPDKIMTCFLEYFPGIVRVHDLIHLREADSWKLLKSCYPKLRLSAETMRQELEQAGLKVDTHETVRGLTIIAAQKP